MTFIVNSCCSANGWLFCCVGGEMLVVYKNALEDLEKRQRELVLAEKLFDLPITMYTKLVKAQRGLSDLSKVYQLYNAFSVRLSLCAPYQIRLQ